MQAVREPEERGVLLAARRIEDVAGVDADFPDPRAGRLKLLAVGSAKRSPAVPDVPTVAESGFPGYEVAVWWGMVAPNGTPKAAQDKFRRELTAVLDQPRSRRMGSTNTDSTATEAPCRTNPAKQTHARMIQP